MPECFSHALQTILHEVSTAKVMVWQSSHAGRSECGSEKDPDLRHDGCEKQEQVLEVGAHDVYTVLRTSDDEKRVFEVNAHGRSIQFTTIQFWPMMHGVEPSMILWKERVCACVYACICMCMYV
jgi:hypothetical protein